MNLRPLHNILICQPLETEQPSGTVYVPEAALWDSHDALVLAAGEGKQLFSDRRYPVMARAGDRVVFQKHSPKGRLEDGTLLLDDRDVVARIPGPEHRDMHPANDYVFVLPDPKETVRASGIVVAHHSLAGGDVGELVRRNELLATWEGMRRKWEFDREPLPEQVRLARKWGESLSPGDKRLVQDFLRFGEADQAQIRTSKPPPRLDRPHRGRIVDVGPGAVGKDGRRKPLWDEVRPALEAGKVVWEREHVAVELYLHGQMVLAIQAKYLAAALEEGAER